MSKILLLTWHLSPNHGTNLQAIALYKVISRDFDVEILHGDINFHIKDTVSKLKKKKLAKKDQSPATLLKRENIEKAFEGIKFYVPKGLNRKKKIRKEFDTFLIGSDQVWNPYFLNDNFLLDFTLPEDKKVTYATSIGVNKLEDVFKEKYQKWLSSFSYISMREQTGADEISKLIDKPVDRVLDPALLLTKEEWMEFAKDAEFEKPLPKKYILYYFVGNEFNQLDKAKVIAKEQDLPLVIIPLNKWDYDKDSFTMSEAGPMEFIHTLANAELILTDSLHMLMFALLFNKKIQLFDRFNNENRAIVDTRIMDFLGVFSLKREDLMNVDYDSFNKKLANERERSINYIQTILK